MNALKMLWLCSQFFLVAWAAPLDAYTVAKGDCLWKIAARTDVYGDPWLWPLLEGANPVLIRDPDRIEPGWRLKVPLNPTDAQVALARKRAQAYKEAPAFPSVELSPEQAVPVTPTHAQVPWILLGILGVIALLTLLVAFVHGLLRPAPAVMEPAPMTTDLPSLGTPETPALDLSEGPPPTAQTESEANLRADQGPDPLHADGEHREAA
jgi:hypothetical protein